MNSNTKELSLELRAARLTFWPRPRYLQSLCQTKIWILEKPFVPLTLTSRDIEVNLWQLPGTHLGPFRGLETSQGL